MKFVVNIDSRKISKGLLQKLITHHVYLHDMVLEDFLYRCSGRSKNVLKLTPEEFEELRDTQKCAPEYYERGG